MTSDYRQTMPSPAPASVPGLGVFASPPAATQTPELATKAVLSQDQLAKFRQTKPIYLMPLNEAGKGTNFPYKSLAEPTPAGVLGYFSDTLATQLAKTPFKMNLEVKYPREHVDALSKWMKKGGGPWTHHGRFCRQLHEVEDMETFVGLVKEWRIDELAPHAERELGIAMERLAVPAKAKEAIAGGKKQGDPQKAVKAAPKAGGNSGRKCFGCGSTEHLLLACPQRQCARCGGGGHGEVDCMHFTNIQIVGIFVDDEFGYRSAIPSNGLSSIVVGARPDGERVFQIIGTVEVSEYGLTRSRKKQERLETGVQNRQPSRESPGLKTHDS